MQYDNVIVLKETPFFNMRYHVKLLVLGVKSLLKLSVTKRVTLQGASVSKASREPGTVGVPHFMRGLTLCSLKVVLVKMYKIFEFYRFYVFVFLAGK